MHFATEENTTKLEYSNVTEKKLCVNIYNMF